MVFKYCTPQEQNQEELQASCEEADKKHNQVIEVLEAQLQDTNRIISAQAKTLKANTQEISALKAMDASEISMLEVDEANRRVTTVFNALGSIGQEICKP